MFGRATIRLGIGPHSSTVIFITSNDSIKVKRKKDIYKQSNTRQRAAVVAILPDNCHPSSYGRPM